MKTFRHSGKIGDIIFSLPTIKALGGGIVYIPENTGECLGLLSAIRSLLLSQSYINEVREYPSGLPYMQQAPGIHIDYDLDLARLQPAKGIIHIVKRYMDAFGVRNHYWKDPWLSVGESSISGSYSIVNYTGRHIKNEQTGRVSGVDWERVFSSIKGRVFFVGTVQEHYWFYHNIAPVDYFQTIDILDLAKVVGGADAVYCNQSCVLALSQALDKKRCLDIKPEKSNCILGTKNEFIL